jgi:hypothetical protein
MVFKKTGTLLFLVILLCSCTRKRAPEPEIAAEAVREEATLSETELPASNSEAYYRIPIKETPEYHSFIYRYERMRDEQLDLLEASIKQYGLQADKTSSQPLNRAGYGLYERKDYANAVRFFREAAYIDPSNVYPHYNLACTLSLIRDSIWADPKNEMDYHHDRHTDYYGIEYKLYETQDNYYDQIDNDQICRNEIFEHLTLACLLDREYLAKASADRDLAGIHNTLRFRRLMDNIQTGKGLEVYGVWYSPQGLMKESYFMLDGSMSHILPNDRPEAQFVKFRYSDCNDDIFDTIIQSRSSVERNFDQVTTGYEYFDSGSSPGVPNQWEYENSQLIIYSQIINKDYKKLAIMAGADSSPEFDYRHIKNIIKTSNYVESIPLDNDNKYINVYSVPYRYVMEDDIASLAEWLKSQSTETVNNALAALALIHDRLDILDMLVNRYEDIDLNRLFLLSCLYVKTELLTRLEAGAYGFDVDQLLAQDGTALINYTAASGNVPFFESIYAKYYQKTLDGLSDQQVRDFKDRLWGWSDKTSNRAMNNMVRNVREGKYNGDLKRY